MRTRPPVAVGGVASRMAESKRSFMNYDEESIFGARLDRDAGMQAGSPHGAADESVEPMLVDEAANACKSMDEEVIDDHRQPGAVRGPT